GEECGFSCADFGSSTTGEQKKHPRKKNHGVPVRELPAARIPVAPKHERQNRDGNPAYRLVFPVFSKDEEEERTAEEDRTAKRRKRDERKTRHVAETFKQHCVDVPWDGLKGKQPVFVPRFITHFGDVKVAKIEN